MSSEKITNEKPPVLIVHGTFGSGGLTSPLVHKLEEAGFTCYAPSLPGRDPSDLKALRVLGFTDYLRAIEVHRDALLKPPIIIGHSMGGLLAQKLAASGPAVALVLLASVPPGVLWAQPSALPHLFSLLPRVLAGLDIKPSESTLRAIVFNGLPESEVDELVPQIVPDSGRAFRSLIFGLERVPRDAVNCPVLCFSGGADLNVSAGISRAIASRYKADHIVLPDRGHWLLGPTAAMDIASPLIQWLEQNVPATIN